MGRFRAHLTKLRERRFRGKRDEEHPCFMILKRRNPRFHKSMVRYFRRAPTSEVRNNIYEVYIRALQYEIYLRDNTKIEWRGVAIRQIYQRTRYMSYNFELFSA